MRFDIVKRCGVVVASLLVGVVSAWADATLITRVELTQEKTSPIRETPNLSGVQMTKFFETRYTGKETYTVYWKAPAGGLSQGVTVLFEYRQKNDPRIRNLNIQYPFLVTGERRSVFVIPEKSILAYGPIYTWRARVVQKGRILAEKTNGPWPP